MTILHVHDLHEPIRRADVLDRMADLPETTSLAEVQSIVDAMYEPLDEHDPEVQARLRELIAESEASLAKHGGIPHDEMKRIVKGWFPPDA